MLILHRHVEDSVIIETSDGDIEVKVIELGRLKGHTPYVRLGIEAPDDCKILRTELMEIAEGQAMNRSQAIHNGKRDLRCKAAGGFDLYRVKSGVFDYVPFKTLNKSNVASKSASGVRLGQYIYKKAARWREPKWFYVRFV